MPFDLYYYRNYTKVTNSNSDNIQELSDAYSQQYNSAISKFDVLINSDRADTIYKDNTLIKCIVDYGREIRKSDFSSQLTREVWTNHDTVKTGDIVDFEYKHSKERYPYLFISSVESRDKYDISFMQKCNNTLTFKNSLGEIISIPCIISNLTLYSDGLEQKTLTLLDGKRNVIIPYNEDTKDIFVQQRFIFNHDAVFSVSLPDNFSVPNLLQLTMIQSQFNDKDDKDNNLAYNGVNLTQPLQQFRTLTVPNNGYFINGNSEIRKTSTNTYTVNKLVDGIEDNSASFNFSLNYNGVTESGIVMSLVNGNSVKIKSSLDSGEIVLRAEDIVSGDYIEKTIMLKGIYG